VEHFNPSVVEYYQTGRMSAEQVKEHFLSFLVVNNGAVTKEEFIAFYDDLNVNYAHNDIFFRYVSSQWHYTPDKLQAVSENEIRTAIKNLRYKLIERTQGSKDELLVRKLFDEYDVNKNFYLSSYDLSQMLNKVGIKLSPVLIERVHQRLDKNDSGYIEFE
jgi:Ca2+-binding EF-hand superfamily protein